jgi:hypothetical protein
MFSCRRSGRLKLRRELRADKIPEHDFNQLCNGICLPRILPRNHAALTVRLEKFVVAPGREAGARWWHEGGVIREFDADFAGFQNLE